MSIDPSASDENLLKLSRSGEMLARNLLWQRYFIKRKAIAFSAAPEAAYQLNDWDLNDAFFSSFLGAEINYAFGRARFSTYFRKSYANALVEKAKEIAREKGKNYVYLDSGFDDEYGERTTLHDIIGVNEDADECQVAYKYARMLERLKKTPKHIDRRALDYIQKKAEGWTIQEIADFYDQTVSQIRYAIAKFRKWAKSILNNRSIK